MPGQMADSSAYWNYFISIEQDVHELSRYVEFDMTINKNAYSLEMARILMTAASEVDVIAKNFLPEGAPSRPNIDHYRDALCRFIPSLPGQPVFIHRFGLELKPWESWSEGRTPDWWRAYNDVKHHRISEFSSATLENVLMCVSALFLLLVHYGKMKGFDRYQPCPQLFATAMDLSVWDYAVCGGAVLSLGNFTGSGPDQEEVAVN